MNSPSRTTIAPTGPWTVEAAPGSGPPLLVFPHAGAGPSAYRRFAAACAPAFRPFVIHLPGRERRRGERAYDSMDALAAAALTPLLPHLLAGSVLYGHSMGALVAFEVARRACRIYGIEPRRLIVSGCAAPRTRVPRTLRHHLPDRQLWQSVCELGGTPEEIARDEGLRTALTPVLRADFRACDTYGYASATPLACPVDVFAGAADPEVDPAETLGWRDETTGPRRTVVVEGGHFFNLAPDTDMPRRIIEASTGSPHAAAATA